MKTCASVLDAIGNTPLIKLRRASEETGCTILGKAEFLNPGQSVKDRAALGIIEAAEKDGSLAPGGTIVEGTAGNTGIGLAFAAACPDGRVTLVDRDFLAVDYTNANAKLNGLANATARLGHGFVGTDPSERFDNVVSNLPAKTGGELLSVLLHDAHAHLKPGGRLCVVTVTGLRRFIERHMKARFGNYKKLKQSPGYTVAMATRIE